MSTEDVTAEIAAVLAEHTWVYVTFQQRTVLACSCGDQLIPATSSGVADFDDHRHHLADLLAARDRRVRAGAVAHERMQQADRLQNEQGALDCLKHQTERIRGKREGVTLALSYIEEDQRMADNRIEADA